MAESPIIISLENVQIQDFVADVMLSADIRNDGCDELFMRFIFLRRCSS